MHLDRAQVIHQRARILALKAERRHVGMPADEPFAQPMHKRIEVDAACERPECRGGGVRA